MRGEQYADAVLNVVSMFGWRGSCYFARLSYSWQINRGSEKFVNFVDGIPHALNNKIYSIRNHNVRMASF